MTSTRAARTTGSIDRVVLACLGFVAIGLAAWSVAEIAAAPEYGLVMAAAIVPHLLIGAIGAFLVLRTSARTLGWLLAGSVIFISTFGGGAAFARTGATWAGVVEATSGWWLTLLMLAIVLYPTGRPESKGLTTIAGAIVVLNTFTSVHWLGVNLAWWELLADPLELAVGLSTLPLFLSFFEQARIYRRRPVEQQKQIKWYVLGLVTAPAYVVPLALGWSEEAFAVVDAFTTMLFPIAILIGITRYRLYEIDRIVSRTMAYGLVMLLLTSVGAATLALLTSLLPSQDRLVVVVTTIAVVMVFNPLRRRIVAAVDQRFDRTRFVAQQIVEAFGWAVRDESELDAVRMRLQDAVGQTMAPATVGVWLPAAASGATRT